MRTEQEIQWRIDLVKKAKSHTDSKLDNNILDGELFALEWVLGEKP